MVKFTDTQKLACDISRNIAVTAGAGSGKTSVLVERYLWCLRNNGYQVRRIVAITFTEKAAGEMAGRIRERILDYTLNGVGDSTRWNDELEQLALANIATIHSFCQSLLREFPIEAGVDPNFDVLDEAGQRLCLVRMIDAVIQQHAEAYDANLRKLADLWSPYTLKQVLLRLLQFRETSLPWAQHILNEDIDHYLGQIMSLLNHLQEQGLRRILEDPVWSATIATIRKVIPEGDTSKLTGRCLNILDYDQQFRTQTDTAEQLLTLKMLERDCRMITPSARWKEDGRSERLKEAFERLRTLYAAAIPPFEFQAGLEHSGFELQQALAEVLLAASTAYEQEKRVRRVLDFDDLQILTRRLLDNPAVCALLAQRYDYLMVDEFQDTNALQWDIIRALGINAGAMRPDAFCIVGDEKQSIYMFRGAEVAVFGEVRQELRTVNAQHHLLTVPPRLPQLGDAPDISAAQPTGELVMAENFRSLPPLIFFFNALFARLFLPAFDQERPYEAQYQRLLARRPVKTREEQTTETAPAIQLDPVEFLFVQQTDETVFEEPELVALRIREIAASVRYADMAILLRTRTRLKEFEDALRRQQIPFVVAGGIGFYQQQEIYDLANLLRVLADQRQDIALAGVLRSPLFSFSDDQLLFLSVLPDGKKTTEQLSSETLTLWRKLQTHARLSEGIPAELDPWKFVHAWNLLSSWQKQCDRIPLTHLLRQIFDDTGWYGLFSGHERETQSRLNIEKLLDLARTFEQQGFQTLRDFVAYLDQLIELEEREGEAQVNFEGLDAVKLMTIHAAKGLEFPLVFVPELDRAFNYGDSDPIHLDMLSFDGGRLPVLGIKGLHPERNAEAEDTVLRGYLKRLNAEKTDAEMKRLLYVACTRAKDHLVLSGTFSDSIPPHSWLAWLSTIFPIEEALTHQGFLLSGEAESSEMQETLHIPVHTEQRYAAQNSLPEIGLVASIEPSGKALRPESGESIPDLISDLLAHSTHPKTPSVATAEHELTATLRRNLTPLKERDNEIFRISPSKIHVLFECPWRYYFHEMLKFPEMGGEISIEDAEDQIIFDIPSQYGRERGTLIHRLFEMQIFDRAQNETELLEMLNPALHGLNISESLQAAMGLTEAALHAYRHYQQSGLRDLLARSSSIFREYPFFLRVAQLEITGTLDVLFLDPDRQQWTILDYKSNDIAASKIPDEITRHGYDYQMQLYALAVSRLLQVECSRSVLFFTSPGVLYDAIDLAPARLEIVVQETIRLLTQLTEGSLNFSEKTSPCEMCGYREYRACPTG